MIIQIQNIKIKISTNYPKYYDYLRLHFGKVILGGELDNFDIEINADWKMDFWGKSPPRILEGEGNYEVLGGSLARQGGKIIWVNKKIKKRRTKFIFSLLNDKLAVEVVSHRKVFRDSLNSALMKKPEELLFFDLTFYAVYYPVFWYLEHFKDTYPLHASAVRIGESAVLMAGLEGLGKTTLALSLLGFPDTSLITDNLLFYDANTVYPCYSPIMIHAHQPASLWLEKLQRINDFKTLKNFYEPLIAPRQDGVKPTAIFMLSFFSRFSLDKISRQECLEALTNINNLSGEINGYNEFANVLNLLDLQKAKNRVGYLALDRLLGDMECYRLRMPKGADVNGIAQEIYSVAEKLKSR